MEKPLPVFQNNKSIRRILINQHHNHIVRNLLEKSMTAAKSTFVIRGAFSADSFVVAESSVLRTNICAENHAHRKSANRSQPMETVLTQTFL